MKAASAPPASWKSGDLGATDLTAVVAVKEATSAARTRPPWMGNSAPGSLIFTWASTSRLSAKRPRPRRSGTPPLLLTPPPPTGRCGLRPEVLTILPSAALMAAPQYRSDTRMRPLLSAMPPMRGREPWGEAPAAPSEAPPASAGGAPTGVPLGLFSSVMVPPRSPAAAGQSMSIFAW